MPEDQDQVVTRRRARRQGTAAQPEQLPLEAQALAATSGSEPPTTWRPTDAVGASSARDTAAEQTDTQTTDTPALARRRPGRPRRNTAAESTETAEATISTATPVTAAASAVETAHHMNALDTLHPMETAESASTTPENDEAPRRARGPRVSRPRAARASAAAEPGADTAAANTPAAPAENAPSNASAEAPVPVDEAPRSRRGRRAARPAAETAAAEQPLVTTTEAAAAAMPEPSVPATSEQPSPARNPYRFGRRARAEEAAATASPEAHTETPTERRAESIMPVRAEETAVADGAITPPPPAATDTAAHEGAPAPEGASRPYRRFDRVMPHVPGGNDPYRRRGQDQGTSGRQGQQGPQGSQGQRGDNQRPAAQPPAQQGPARGGPYSPGAGGRAQPPAGPPSGYEGQPPYGPGAQNGGQNGMSPYGNPNPYDYTGYATSTGTPVRPGYPNRSGRRGYNQPGYPEQRGTIPGRQDGRGMRGTHGVNDRRGGRGGFAGRPGREQPGYGPGMYPPAQAPAEGRYGQPQRPAPVVRTVEVSGLLWLGGGSGMSAAEILDGRTLQPLARMNTEDVRRMGLRSGDIVSGRAEERAARRIVVAVDTVNGVRPDELRDRPQFEQLTASFPDRRIRLEQGPQPISARIIDLFAPLGFGSRALIVAPPKTGKTTLIREAAESVLAGYADAVVMAVLVGERPEEVTDLRSRLEPRGGFVYAASFDEDTQRHAWLVQVAVERAKRVAESGKDAFMVLDSLTRLARAENLATRGSSRTLSGGIDAQALDTGRRAFGAARNLEEGGSLTILATCLVDTGSRQDEVVYEEFKGTGNMELHLSRELSQRRLFPAVDAVKSGTRREEMLLTPEELRAATALRRRLADLPVTAATEQLLRVMERTPSNAALISAVDASAQRGTI